MKKVTRITSIVFIIVLLTSIGFCVSALYKKDEVILIPENYLVGMNVPQRCIVADLTTDVLPIEKPEVVIVTIEELINSTIEELISEIEPIEKPKVVIVSVEEPTKEVKTTETVRTTKTNWKGKILNKTIGTVKGPNGKETYYNLEMSGVIRIMRNLGYSADKYPYYVREDGVKMLGPYIICAANLKLRPRGTILETSLGKAIVCDTGEFAKYNPKQLDIAVNW